MTDFKSALLVEGMEDLLAFGELTNQSQNSIHRQIASQINTGLRKAITKQQVIPNLRRYVKGAHFRSGTLASAIGIKPFGRKHIPKYWRVIFNIGAVKAAGYYDGNGSDGVKIIGGRKGRPKRVHAKLVENVFHFGRSSSSYPRDRYLDDIQVDPYTLAGDFADEAVIAMDAALDKLAARLKAKAERQFLRKHS